MDCVVFLVSPNFQPNDCYHVVIMWLSCGYHGSQEATGGVLVAREASKIILFRGWMDGEPAPWERPREVEMSEEMREAMLEEMRGGVREEIVSMGLEDDLDDDDDDEIIDGLEEGEGESWEDQFGDDDDEDEDEDQHDADSVTIGDDGRRAGSTQQR